MLDEAVLIAAVRFASAPSVVEHIHLDFSDKFLRRLFIPLDRHELLRLFLIATDVTAGFVVDHQPFTRADVRNNRVASG